MESAHSLCIGNALDGVSILVHQEVTVPLQLAKVTVSQDVDDGILVQGPAVHVGVQTLVGYRTEEEGLTRLPWFASHHPGITHGSKGIIAGILLESGHGIIQVTVAIAQVPVRGQYHHIHILGHHRIQHSVGIDVVRGLDIALQTSQGIGQVLRTSSLGSQRLVAVDVVTERLGNGQDGIVSRLDGLHRSIGQVGINAAHHRIDGVLGGVHLAQVQLVVADRLFAARTRQCIVDGDDVVGVVLAGVPAVPGLHGIQGTYLVATVIHGQRVANLSIAHLVGNVQATVNNLLHTVQCTAVIRGISGTGRTSIVITTRRCGQKAQRQTCYIENVLLHICSC